MPALRVVDMDAGHGVNMQDAAGFNHAVADFIAEHDHPAGPRPA